MTDVLSRTIKGIRHSKKKIALFVKCIAVPRNFSFYFLGEDEEFVLWKMKSGTEFYCKMFDDRAKGCAARQRVSEHVTHLQLGSRCC